MTTRLNWLISFLLLAFGIHAQTVSAVYKIDQLLKRIGHKDTTYVVNFWATWCKPCVEELPAFDSLAGMQQNKTLKVLLVCLDFKEELDKKVKPFLVRKNIHAECVLLDEINGNDFVDKISPKWSGAIPATLFKKGDKKTLTEAKMKLAQLQAQIDQLQ